MSSFAAFLCKVVCISEQNLAFKRLVLKSNRAFTFRLLENSVAFFLLRFKMQQN